VVGVVVGEEALATEREHAGQRPEPPVDRRETDHVFFGATVVYANGGGLRRTVTIVGKDEADPGRGEVSWLSPVARALMRRRVGEVAVLLTPVGEEELEIVEVRYGPVT
jgi:transcription elongation factor GreB